MVSPLVDKRPKAAEDQQEVGFPRKGTQVIVFMLVEKAGLRLHLHIQFHRKKFNTNMLVNTSTDSREILLALKDGTSIIFEGQPSLMHSIQLSGFQHFMDLGHDVVKFIIATTFG